MAMTTQNERTVTMAATALRLRLDTSNPKL